MLRFAIYLQWCNQVYCHQIHCIVSRLSSFFKHQSQYLRAPESFPRPCILLGKISELESLEFSKLLSHSQAKFPLVVKTNSTQDYLGHLSLCSANHSLILQSSLFYSILACRLTGTMLGFQWFEYLHQHDVLKIYCFQIRKVIDLDLFFSLIWLHVFLQLH